VYIHPLSIDVITDVTQYRKVTINNTNIYVQETVDEIIKAYMELNDLLEEEDVDNPIPYIFPKDNN
jgi:hypothetical protein